jgi:colicin import membrane protein
MDRVTKRWKARAAAEGWKTHAATSASAAAPAMRSGTAGTAPASADPNQPKQATGAQ